MQRWGQTAAGYAFVALVFVASFLLASFQVSDPDMFIQLTGGKIICSSGFPTTNVTSFTWGSYPYQHIEWLFGLLLYLVHLLGGFAAISVLTALVVAGAFALTADTLRRRIPADTPPLAWALLLPPFVAALAACQFRFVPRPQIMSFLGLALLLNLWERQPRRLPLWFALTGCLWANLHPGMVFGAAACVAIAVTSFLPGTRQARTTALGAAAAFIAGSLVNPFFLGPHVYSFKHLFIGDIVTLVEFKPPALADNPIFFWLAAAVLATLPFPWRRRDLLHASLVAGFLPATLAIVRLIPKFLLLSLPGLCQAAAETLRGAPGRWRRAGTAAVALAGALLLALAAKNVVSRPHHNPMGWGLNGKRIPSGAADLLVTRALRGRIYNDFGHGGYLMWRLYPNQLVFQDGRNLAYPPEFLREVVNAQPAAWLALLDKYGIQVAVLARSMHELAFNKGALLDGRGWTMVYVDGVSMVYVRPGSPDMALVRDLALRLVRPWMSQEALAAAARENPQGVLAELRRLDPERFLNPMECLRFGVTALQLDDARVASGFVRAGLALAPAHPGLQFNLALALDRQGLRQEAMARYGAFIERNPGNQLLPLARSRLDILAR